MSENVPAYGECLFCGDVFSFEDEHRCPEITHHQFYQCDICFSYERCDNFDNHVSVCDGYGQHIYHGSGEEQRSFPMCQDWTGFGETLDLGIHLYPSNEFSSEQETDIIGGDITTEPGGEIDPEPWTAEQPLQLSCVQVFNDSENESKMNSRIAAEDEIGRLCHRSYDTDGVEIGPELWATEQSLQTSCARASNESENDTVAGGEGISPRRLGYVTSSVEIDSTTSSLLPHVEHVEDNVTPKGVGLRLRQCSSSGLRTEKPPLPEEKPPAGNPKSGTPTRNVFDGNIAWGYQCNKCPMTFREDVQLHSHLKNHAAGRGSERGVFKCVKCPKVCCRKSDLTRHGRFWHPPPHTLTEGIDQWLHGVYNAPRSPANCEVELETQSPTFDSVCFPPTMHAWPQALSSSVLGNSAGIQNLPHALPYTPGSYKSTQLPSYQQTPYYRYTIEAAPDNSLRDQGLEAVPKTGYYYEQCASQHNVHTQQLEPLNETPLFANPKLENVNANIANDRSVTRFDAFSKSVSPEGLPANNGLWPQSRPRVWRAYSCTACAFRHIRCEKSSGSSACKNCTKRNLVCKIRSRILKATDPVSRGQSVMFDEVIMKVGAH